MKIPVEKVLPNPEQPRKDFDMESLQELAESIAEHGMIQAITVEQVKDEYILIDGERRLRAHKLLGYETIDAEVREPKSENHSEERLKLAMIANIQRKDMNPIEEARAYDRLHKKGKTQEEIGRLVGQTGVSVCFKLSLLKLQPEVQDLFGKRLIPLDGSVVRMLQELPKDVQVKLCRKFAANRTSAGYIKGVCKRFLNNPEHLYNGVGKKARHGVPMLGQAEIVKEKKYDVLVAAGKIPQWENLVNAAKATCETCSLSDVASASICKECPAVDLIKRLMK